MGPEEDSKQHNSEAQVAADLAALSARVETLEREIALLRRTADARTPAPPPPLVSAAPIAEGIPPAPAASSAPNFAKRIPAPRGSLENRIGSQLFSRIGIVALLIGATWFLKLAMDNHWIGPTGRILAGLIAGTGIVLWSERFRRHGFHAFSYSLKATGSGVLYLSLWAAFQLYHLMPAGLALGAMILVTAWNAYMAWAQDSELLAAYALAGGFATPLLLSTGHNQQVFLFTYILAIDVATVALVRLKPWPRLLLGAFPATVAFFIGWYVQFNSSDQLASSILFVALFFLAFASVAISRPQAPKRTASLITEVLLPLANAAFASLALYSLLQDSGHHDLVPWVMLLFAALYLGLMRLPETSVASAVHLSLAIVFLTITIPLKASGRWITVGWLTEGVALLWVSAHLSVPAAEDTPASVHRILRWLAIGAMILGFFGLLSFPYFFDLHKQTAFLNTRFATALFGIAALGAAAWICLHARQYPDESSPTWRQIAGASVIALNLVAVLACVREIGTVWNNTTANVEADLQRSLAVSAFLMLYGAALLAVGFWKRTAFIRWQALILLVFTIGKTFLYDMRNLSQGYRVVSFLCLGALLMAISFAYQKDWLALRDPGPSPDPDHKAEAGL
jgi:uncharacterized membrane protein